MSSDRHATSGRRSGWARLRPLLIVLAGIAMTAGCGRRDMGRVTGRVTFGGRPVPDAVVSFRPKNRPMAVGKTDPDGRYVLNTFSKGDGAFLGDCQVTVGPFAEGGSTIPDANTPARSPTEDPRPDIPRLYRSPATSPLTAEVVAGKKNAFNFELSTSEGSSK